jgi:hypothetical protein
MPTLPPTETNPLIISTPDGRWISCAVHRLRRRPSEPRWLFTVDLDDLGGTIRPATFVGPAYIKGDHDDVAAIRALACEWWRRHREMDRPRVALVRRLSPPID